MCNDGLVFNLLIYDTLKLVKEASFRSAVFSNPAEPQVYENALPQWTGTVTALPVSWKPGSLSAASKTEGRIAICSVFLHCSGKLCA